MQKEDLAVIEIEGCPVVVKANLGGGLAKIVVGVIIFITSVIKIMEELVVFIKYKASKLEVFRVAITGKVRKSVEVIRQQQ
jgi:hypothetical protein